MKMKIALPTLCWLGLALLTLSSVQAGNPAADPMDWTYWRGPEQNGISREKNLPESWDPKGENLIWKREDLATRSTPIVMNGKLYVLCRDQPGTIMEGEKCVCVDAATGETIWEQRWNAFLTDVPDTRVAWSAVVGDPETGNVFALGVCGQFQAMDGKTGEVLWQHSLSEEYGLLSTYGGRTNFPIVHENLVIISAVMTGWGDLAKPAHRFIGFDKRNGQPVWLSATSLLPEDTTYSSPVLATIDGQVQLIFASGDGGVHGFQPRTGKPIWSYDASGRGINMTPVVVGNKVLCGHSEENIDAHLMGALFLLDATKTGDITETGEIWRNKEQFVGKSVPLVVDGRIYAIEDNANMLILDFETGKLIGKQKLGTMQRSSPLYADGKIYVCDASGRWYIMVPDEKGVKIIHRLRLNREESHGSPIASHGRIYIPTTGALYCIGLKDQTPSADPIPEAPQETPVTQNLEPAHLQVVPVESLLRPGKTQQFQIRVYNKLGQFLGLVEPEKVEFSLQGPGSIDKQGKYSTPSENVHAGVIVTAKYGELTQTARVRVVPPLPWKVTFDNGQIPETWVGVNYRHIPIDFDFLMTLQEKDPLAAQLYIYLQTSFVNSGRPAVKFDRSTAQQTMTAFLRFLNMVQTVTTIEEGKAKLDASLKILQEEKFLKSWDWSTNDAGMVFTAAKGDRQISGNGALMKITTIPKGTRSQGWMGHPDFNNYTIQADVFSLKKDDRLPDIGLIGQRYTLDLMGASNQIQIRTWHAQLRMAQQVPFQWKHNTWYTMKLQSSVEDGKAVLRGKVWPRDEQEPAEWMVEATDPSPNLIGSPGLFGNAKDAEVIYDNLLVYPNDQAPAETPAADPAKTTGND